MGKFDRILLVSDWDGTLFWDGKLPENNLTAIRRFQENGGLFTFASGRMYSFLRSYRDLIRPNTYVLACNGAMIYDLEERLVYDGVCDDRLYDLIDRAFALDVGYHSVLLYMADNPVEDGHEIYTKEEYLANRASFCGRPAHKAVMITTDSASGLLGSQLMNGFDLGEYFAVRSWGMSLEFMKEKNGKGASLRRIKQLSGARLAIAVGDYENDLSMLRAADISYAPANALDAVKQTVDRVTVHCKDGSIAAIIEDLERECGAF